MEAHKLTIDQLSDYLNKIFELQFDVLKKDFKITNLEFQLTLAKQQLESYKLYSVKGEL